MLDLDITDTVTDGTMEALAPEDTAPDPEGLLLWLTSPVTLERMQAARAFCEIQDERAPALLLPLLTDDCALVRVSAAYALGRNPTPDLVPVAIARLADEWNGYVRKGLVWALGNCGDERALPPLVSALQYDITAVRLWAASALGQLAKPAAIGPLCTALERDPSTAVQSNCVWALGRLLPLDRHHPLRQTAIAAIIAALERDDLGLQEDARATLRKLGDPQGLAVLEKIDLEQGYCDLY
ncbi:MAG: HEAT repeat domain-containing protein [Pseudanabaenaceae cyanobacterium]